MKIEVEIWLDVLSVILFLGFGTAAMIAFSTIDKQKEITISSRYGRHTGPLEILYVNVALVLVAVMLYAHNYRFLPAVCTFILLIFFNSRMQSGIAPIGVFIGTTYLEWNKIKAYKIVNDEISTVQVRVFANKKQYVLRCDKEQRSRVDAYFIEHGIPDRES
ncbi:MAG: DUF5673 domain-containing protein [Bacteroidales bacterium]|nr:DUF5673 domain-containing protein [Clostridium sp.]MCM1204354.1 DUF5673 domain-containing protein [Bacteroidales bacterium]